MNIQLKKIVSILAVSCSVLFAAGDPGDYSFELAPDAAAQGRGGGSAAEINSEALYHNPAGLGFNVYNSVSLGRQMRESFDLTTFSYVHPFNANGVVGIAFYNDGLSTVHNQYSEYGEHIGTDQGGEREIVIGYAYPFMNMISVGLNFKMAHQEVANYTDMGFGFDFGLLYSYENKFMAGLSLVNLFGPEILLVNESESYATVLKTGVAGHLLNDALVLNADIDVVNVFGGEDIQGNYLEQSTRYRAGVAWAPIKYATLRTGVNGVNIIEGIADDVWYSIGAGVNVNNFSVDYAFSTSLLSDDAEIGMESNHYVSLNYLIGKPYEKEKEDLIQRVKDLESQISLNKAREEFIKQKYTVALEHMQEYLVVYPADSSALAFKEEIRGELNKERVQGLEKEFEQTIQANQLVKSKAILDDIILLSPKYENLAALQKKLLNIEQVNEIYASIKNLNPKEASIQIMEGIRKIKDITTEFIFIEELEEDALPYYNQHKAKELYAQASSFYYEKKDVQKAHQILQEVLLLDKDNADAQKLYEEIGAQIKKNLMQQIAEGGDDQDLLGQVVALDLDQQYLKANNLFEDKDYVGAEVTINKILRKDAKHQKALALLKDVKKAAFTASAEKSYQEALMAYNEKNIDLAFKQITKTLEINSEHEKAKELQKSMVQSTIKDIEKLYADYVSTQDPEQLKSAKNMLEALTENGITNDAIAILLLNIETEENVIMIKTIIEDGKYDIAEQELNKVLLKNPDSKSANSTFEMLRELKEIMQ